MIKIESISVRYPAGLAVKDVSFEIHEEDYWCIVGENGSGKSTLMKAILGLEKICAGRIEFQGIKRNEIGYLPQQTQVQKDFPSSVYEIVLSGFQSKTGLVPLYTKRQKRKAHENIEIMGAKDLSLKCYKELSGGQQQRVLLARALCATDRIIMLDEPAAGLDPQAQHDLYKNLAQLNKAGITIVMISHDLEMAKKYSTHLLEMHKA
jgi:zinc transport system ATP-binding protein